MEGFEISKEKWFKREGDWNFGEEKNLKEVYKVEDNLEKYEKERMSG